MINQSNVCSDSEVATILDSTRRHSIKNNCLSLALESVLHIYCKINWVSNIRHAFVEYFISYSMDAVSFFGQEWKRSNAIRCVLISQLYFRLKKINNWTTMVSTRQMSIVGGGGGGSDGAGPSHAEGTTSRTTRHSGLPALPPLNSPQHPSQCTGLSLLPNRSGAPNLARLFNTGLLDLPPELLEKIFSYLKFKAVAHMRLVRALFIVHFLFHLLYIHSVCYFVNDLIDYSTALYETKRHAVFL